MDTYGGQRFAQGNIESVDQFTDLIKNILDKAWGDNWGVFSAEDPTGNDPDEHTMPHITYKLFSRVPSKSIPSPKPRYMQTIQAEDNPGDRIEIYRQWFDCRLDFVIWGRTGQEAEQAKSDFEDLMLAYTWFFKQKGISDIRFQAEFQPSVSTKWRQDLPHRVLRYFVRIERVTKIRSVALTELTTTVDVAGQAPDEFKESIYIGGRQTYLDPIQQALHDSNYLNQKK